MQTGLFQTWKQKRFYHTCFFAAFSCLPPLAFHFGGCFPAQQVNNVGTEESLSNRCCGRFSSSFYKIETNINRSSH